ncbi:hypothetical protein BpHYR1_043493 [Brachionus plicatilis]|uniref:Uncharacterized protein n=1 Tax=Brachionus plicatilis TaxID=10195 RepID=A0A3M7S714_BRAPC|nr:hypothetical protein BpHYR1_043493 [Brachionus plicatilis]
MGFLNPFWDLTANKLIRSDRKNFMPKSDFVQHNRSHLHICCYESEIPSLKIKRLLSCDLGFDSKS